MANVLFPVNHPLAVKIWGTKLIREALKETYCSRFMGTSKDSLIYVKNELNKGAGDTIYCGLRMQLTGAGVLGDATLEGNEEELSLYRDTLVINQLRHATRSGGEMSEQRVPFSVREEGLDGQRDWWADRLDTAFFNQIGGVETAAANYDGGQTPTAPTSAAGNTRVLYGAGSTSTTASFTATSSNSGSIRQVNFQLPAIDKMVNQAKISTPMVRPLRVDGQYKYVLFLHPNQVRQLRGAYSTASITWFDIMRARAEGGEGYKSNPIYNGALGEYNGVIMHESSRVPALSTDANVKKAILCGAQAATYATGRRDRGTEMKWVEEYFDYENQLGISSGMIFGMKKMVFNSIDFSTIVTYSHSPNPS
jgi:N4-gp56 family major capsid protein